MKHAVITGSTRGIGNAMAEAFLAKGWAVTISGRKKEVVDETVSKMAEHYEKDRIFGAACDVTDMLQVENLWEQALKKFGTVDIWVNNAGISHDQLFLWDIPPEEMYAVTNINILGTLHGVRAAMRGMLNQGHGKIFNLEGYGSSKRIQAKLNAYGTSKAAITFIAKALALETRGTPIITGTLQPGMVVTDLIEKPFSDDAKGWEEFKPILNIIADVPENVGPFLVEKMIDCKKNGSKIEYTSGLKIMWRFITSRFSKRDLFTNEN
ncbi:MAG: SDR family oxidoreductase [Anaerolineaceae bacterium]|nr:SDR family oxidoreductase [Anaerolineaceae bacterium]